MRKNRKLVMSSAFSALMVLISSCEKSEITETTENSEIIQELTLIDESNIGKTAWENFPKELKGAITLESTPIEESNNSKAFSYSVGPFGGRGGDAFNLNPPSGTKIHAIAIRSGGRIDAIIIYYKAPNGTVYEAASEGGKGGDYSIHFFDNDEYIRRISGKSGRQLDRLAIETNKRVYTHGGTGGTEFNVIIPPTGFHVLGFYGRSGRLIDQIGFHIHTL